MNLPIRSFLTEFSSVARPAEIDQWDTAAAAAAAEEAALAEAERIQDLVETARREGLDEGRREAEAEAEARSLALAEEHAAALLAARADWSALEGSVLAKGLRDGLARLEASLAEGLAAAIMPLVPPALRSRTVADLNQALTELVAGGNGKLIQIKGPADILATLRATWTDRSAVAFTIADEAEVVVTAGDTTIRSHIQAWSNRFHAAFQVSA